MSNVKLLTVTNAPEHAEVLRRSAELHEWDLTIIEKPWFGFGTKLVETYNWLKEHPEVTEFIFCDAFDVVVLGNEEEFRKKVSTNITGALISSEKGLWPPILHPFERLYCHHPQPCKFIYPNSGLYYMKSSVFKHWFEYFPPSYEIDDQFWLSMCYLQYKTEWGANEVGLNFAQHVFNSHSFIDEGEYFYDEKRIYVNDMEKSWVHAPIFVHSNGKTKDPKLYELVRRVLG